MFRLRKYELVSPSELIIKAGNEWLNNTIENVQYSRGFNMSAHLDYNPNYLDDFDNDIAVIKVFKFINIYNYNNHKIEIIFFKKSKYI